MFVLQIVYSTLLRFSGQFRRFKKLHKSKKIVMQKIQVLWGILCVFWLYSLQIIRDNMERSAGSVSFLLIFVFRVLRVHILFWKLYLFSSFVLSFLPSHMNIFLTSFLFLHLFLILILYFFSFEIIITILVLHSFLSNFFDSLLIFFISYRVSQ